MSTRIETLDGLFGEKIHCIDGEKVAESWPGLFDGSYDHYNANGDYLGCSEPGVFTDLIHRASDGSMWGYSQRGVFGGMDHYSNDDYLGYSYDSMASTTTLFED